MASTQPPLALFVLDGKQAGACAPLQSGASIDISGEIDTDIVLRDPQMAGQHIRLSVGREFVKLDVLEGDAELSGQQIGAGSSVELPPYVPLKIGATTLAYGETNSTRWVDMLQLGRGSRPSESAQLNMHAEPSPHYQQAHKPSPDVVWEGWKLWLSVIGVGVLVLILGAGGFSGASAPKTAQQVGGVTDIAAVLADAEFSALEVVEPAAGKIAIHGYLETREQRERLVRLLAEPAGFPQVQVRVQVGEQLAATVRDIYRLNGVPANVQPQGPGIVHVKTAEADLGKLRRVETVAKRDIASLLDLVAENERPPDSVKPAKTVDDPGKRIASVVPGDPAYLVTTDGARYFVGAMLPTGHKISAISDQQVLLDKDGVVVTLRF